MNIVLPTAVVIILLAYTWPFLTNVIAVAKGVVLFGLSL